MPGDAAMDADLSVIVARDPLSVFVGPAGILAETRTAPRFLALRRTVEADLHRVGIVERDRPGRGRRAVDHRALGHRVGVRRELVDVWRDEIGDPYPNPIALAAGVDVDHTGRGLHPIPFA